MKHMVVKCQRPDYGSEPPNCDLIIQSVIFTPKI